MGNESSLASPRNSKVLAQAGIILAGVGLFALLLTALLGFPALIVALVSAVAGFVISALAYRSPENRGIAVVAMALSAIELVTVVLLVIFLTPMSVHRQ